jgi:multiple sugar transport system substrate-binding protein
MAFRWNKRALGAAAAVGALSLALTACSGGDDTAGGGGEGSGETVNLEFWGWVPGLEETVATWNEAHPDIQVEFFRMTGDDGDKIPAAIDAGTAPDVVQMSSHSLPGHIINDRLTDITEYAGELEDDFTPSSWGSVVFDGKVYAVPQDSGPSGLLYRTDLFEQYGIDVPTTWDEYLEAARALKAADPNVYIAQFSPNEAGFWIQSVWQNSGSWFGIENGAWSVTVNDDASQDVAEIWQTLLDEDLVKVVEMWTPEYWAEVNAGTIATINYGAWFPALLKESAADLTGKWGIAPTPTFSGSEAAGESGGSVNVVPRGTEHVAEAVEFISWLNATEEGTSALISGGVFPSATVGQENADLLVEDPYFGGQVVNQVFADAAATVPGSWVDGPTYDLTQNYLKDAFAQVGNGQITFAEALDQVQAKTVKDLTDMGLEVNE